jgi:hypothetical protein
VFQAESGTRRLQLCVVVEMDGAGLSNFRIDTHKYDGVTRRWT